VRGGLRSAEGRVRESIMTLILKSNEQYDELLELEPETGFATSRSRKPGTAREAIQGHFVKTPESFACLYRWKDRLVFRHDNVAYEIPTGAVATLVAVGPFNVLRVMSGNTELCSWAYPKPQTDFIDALRWVDEEDMDFGLFVRNVINDKDRQDRIYRQK
jgi:hypothetical protein